MKTFKAFMMESEGDSRITEIRAEIRKLMGRGRPGDNERIAELTKEVQQLVKGQNLEAQAGATLKKIQQSDNPDKLKSSQHTWTSGKPKTQKGGEISSVGTQDSVARQTITDMRTGRDIGSGSTPGENVSGLHGDTRSRSQGGGTVPTRNRGQGNVRPERGNP